MKLTLPVKDRVVLKALYPQESNLQAQLTMRDVETKVRLTEKEIKELNFRQEEASFTWDKELDVEIDFTESEMSFLKDRFSELDKTNKIIPQLVDLCLLIKDA